jgi:hypothetical protein
MTRKKIKKSGETPAPDGSTGPSREYRELLNGEITADDYIKKVKEEVDELLERERAAQFPQRGAAAG